MDNFFTKTANQISFIEYFMGNPENYSAICDIILLCDHDIDVLEKNAGVIKEAASTLLKINNLIKNHPQEANALYLILAQKPKSVNNDGRL